MYMAGSNVGNSSFSRDEICESYLLFHGETFLSNGLRAFLYLLALACCFIGLSAITARFFRSMENIVKQTRCIVEIDSCTNAEVIKYEKFWNYTIADISLLAFGTSFPQISLATIDAIRNLGQLDAGGVDTKSNHPLGGFIDSFTIRIAAESCLCSGQALAIFIYSTGMK